MAARLLEASAAAVVGRPTSLYRLTGRSNSVYLLGPLAAVACFYAVWLLAREVAGRVEALIAVLALEGIHFYNFSVVKFAHDQMQLPFWAFTGLFFYRALTRGARRSTGCSPAPSWPARSGRNTRRSRWRPRSGCSCCSIRSRGAPGARPAPT